MNTNTKLMAAMIALAGMCGLIGMTTIHAAAPALTTSHAIALTAGVAILAAAFMKTNSHLSSSHRLAAAPHQNHQLLASDGESPSIRKDTLGAQISGQPPASRKPSPKN